VDLIDQANELNPGRADLRQVCAGTRGKTGELITIIIFMSGKGKNALHWHEKKLLPGNTILYHKIVQP